MTDLSTHGAARQLGVSQRQVQRLISSGQLNAKRTVGGALIMDPLAVNARDRQRVGAGRPWAPPVVWGTLWLASGLSDTHLSYSQLRRARERLLTIELTTWLAQTRHRARVHRFRAAPSAITALQTELALTAASAAEGFGLAASATSVDGYCSQAKANELVTRLALIADDRGAVTIRVPTVDWVLDDARIMPEAVVATDLASSFEVRERSAGERELSALLQRFHG